MGVLDASCPRGLRLARRVASLAIFVGVLLILTTLFTIEAVAQGQIPSKPQNLTATAGDGKLDMSWDAPQHAGSQPITHYDYAYLSSAGNQAFTSTGGTGTTLTITGLTNGVTYTIRVRAVNSVGFSNYVETTAIPNIAAPTGLTATAGDRQVTLSWTAPSVTTITGYQYQKGTDAWASAGTSSPYIVTGLTNDTAYTFKVRAVGSGGGGTASTSKSATPRPSPPAAPTGFTATAGNRQVKLSWTAPAGPITRYDYSKDDGTTWTSTGSTSTTYTVTGLTNDTAYTFKVRGVNTGGNGTASASKSATPRPSPPAAPTNLTVVAGDGKVRLSWTAPSGYTTITGYQYQKDTDAWTSAGTSSPYTVTNLTNGTSYAFKVRAVGTGGSGMASTSVTARPQLPNPPDAPTGLSTTPGNAQVTLSWTAPTIFVTHYEYRQDDGDWTSTGGISTTLTITNLTNGTAYTFSVRGVNSAGNGAAASVTATPLRAAPRDPVNLQVEMVPDEDKKTAKAVLTWNPPSNAANTEGETFGYEYRYKSNPWTPWTSTGSSETTHTVTGLEFGKEYTFQIRAFYVREGETPDYIYTSLPSTSSNSVAIVFTPPKKSSIFECPVGWQRADRFAGNTRRALLYEIKLEVDLHNRFSIYKPVSVAIYVHPDEGLETLEGWQLRVAFPNNHHREYPLTVENSVVVDANIEGVSGGFAFIANPEVDPFPMVGIGFTGRLAPGFDYRLYDDKGRRVDFGVSCYTRFDIFQVLKDMEDPSVLRQVNLETLDWDVPYIRSEWTVPVPENVQGAPSLRGVNLVGKWADLKKQP